MDERRAAGDPAEEEWVRALKRRAAWAWERLHQVALDRVFGSVSRHVLRRKDAEDLTAEVFAAAVASIAQLTNAQLNAGEMAEGARLRFGLEEWDLARSDTQRPHLRYLVTFTPPRRQELHRY